MLQIHPSNDQERYKTCSRGFPLRKILQYDLTRNCLLFDEVGLERYKKHEIFKPLESDIKEQEYKLNWNNDLETAVVLDFMSMIKKVPISSSKKCKWHCRVNMGSNDGLAQGSILGPLLFLIYVNHISQTVKSTFLLYAHDSCIFYQHKELDEIEKHLNKDLWLVCG